MPLERLVDLLRRLEQTSPSDRPGVGGGRVENASGRHGEELTSGREGDEEEQPSAGSRMSGFKVRG